MKNKIKRHTLIEIIEHWSIALSGIVLLFTGLGCLPLYKRYYITEIPGFGWTSDFYNVTMVHYIASVVFVAGVIFHIFYHGLRKDFGLLPKKGDLSKSIKVIAAMIGIGKEPPSDKYLPEQRIAYVGIGLIILILTVTGIIKILKNLQWIVLSPTMESINTLIHTLTGFLFMFAFIVHVGTVLLFKSNWPLLKSMFTGWIDEEYVKRRHSIWYEKIKMH
ncbi:MAG: cytochrome b/b6 domain-containing protein [Thermodesulfovibrio sp.]|uniref:formate dehydrogenase subunit gamma n=1 Tax=unclassified Thermodesulfovibrio TaxID=2645936 RepID=UPI00083A3FDA|nr:MULTISPECIES: cytochrome b/b6 domain-containing protein [unclassified Thermodesulfovibrio]MDI1472312.1 cytochrome b/b6 domain-containing protein [Thermodesulfovibrio sp. 1176]MDI6714177.1 cytochrome b/b6 domain-containing protein [Thermodesulfovibrio sp.]ODA44924.1 Oxidoreductase, cytochrome b membrane subunit [Thermodesulfovibrio sp. N1]